MRILLLTDAFPPEIRSSSLLMRELAEDLSQAGHIVTVLTCQPRYNLAQENSENSLPLQRETTPGIEIIRVATPAIRNVSHWRRGPGQLSLPLLFYRTARKLSPPSNYPVLLSSAPSRSGSAMARPTMEDSLGSQPAGPVPAKCH